MSSEKKPLQCTRLEDVLDWELCHEQLYAASRMSVDVIGRFVGNDLETSFAAVNRSGVGSPLIICPRWSAAKEARKKLRFSSRHCHLGIPLL